MWRSSLLVVAALAAPAHADPEPTVKPATVEKDFGVGLAIGSASGPNFQFMPTQATQITLAFGVGSLTSTRIQADFAWRTYYFARTRSQATPFYVGGGLFFTDRSWGFDLGVRMPLGVQSEWQGFPLQVFGEVTPELAILQTIGEGVMEPARDPRTRVSLRGMLGLRATF